MSNEKLFAFWKPMVFHTAIGLPLGFSFAILNIHAGEIFLRLVLKNTVLGLLLFGAYYVILGIAGLAGTQCDVTVLKKTLNYLSVPKWMSMITGTLIGISIAALCKNSGISAFGILGFASIFLGFAWLSRDYEIEVLGDAREGKNLSFRALFSPVLSLLIGAIALCSAWHKICSCGG